ncbi:MAG: TerB N-terminal domain-containing protein [Tissierellales bacterium]|nr:TerB N-terminal domain-containing protein [Tissierellales bacterium]
MSIFDIFRKKETLLKTIENDNDPIPSKSTEVTVCQNPAISIHDDLVGLIWFADGPFKNYVNDNIEKNTFIYNGLKITLRMTGDEEPSQIFTKQHIVIPDDTSLIERPPYFPTYSGLTPEQKGVYIKLLQNPYNQNIDIGFVFILYYGLERHLLIGDYERAYKVILKLRNVHSNKSFQSYTANALVLTSMLQQKGEIALDFIKSLDKSYEYSFSDNLFLLCYFSFEIPITANDIIRMARTFEFSNMNYIKKYPDLFQSVLETLIVEKYGENTILLSRILSKSDISKLSTQDTPIFANTSIRDKSFPVPIISSNFKLKKEFNILLENAHEIVKKNISEMRIEGKLKEEKTEKSPKELPVFNKKEENELLDSMEKVKDDFVQRHFIYISIQNFYYKYRELDEKYLLLCIDYCMKDIQSLNKMEEQYIQSEINQEKDYAKMMGTQFNKQQEEKIRDTGFIGRIPAFSRLAIIFEKQKNYEKAIEICDIAISFKHESEEYIKRKEKIIKKMEKEN